MRVRPLSIGGDPCIRDPRGREAFHVDGAARRSRDTFVLEDAAGREVATVRRRTADVRDTMEIERAGREVARVRTALLSPLRDRFDVEFATGDHWRAQGNVLAHEYRIDGEGGKVAEVSRKWLRGRDAYGVEVEPGQDDGMVLAVASAIDEMRRE